MSVDVEIAGDVGAGSAAAGSSVDADNIAGRDVQQPHAEAHVYVHPGDAEQSERRETGSLRSPSQRLFERMIAQLNNGISFEELMKLREECETEEECETISFMLQVSNARGVSRMSERMDQLEAQFNARMAAMNRRMLILFWALLFVGVSTTIGSYIIATLVARGGM